jgi:16S rRNA (cytosine1402-N4)-methyltransferase
MDHISVLLKEVLEVIRPRSGGKYFDGTLGGGGHAKALLEASSPAGELAASDLDQKAVSLASHSLAQFGTRCHIFRSNYTEIDRICAELEWGCLDGIVLDLGMSSIELDEAERGFSFEAEGPLDMRYNSEQTLDAHAVINTYSTEALSRIIYTFGEERFARRITRHIVESRPIITTKALAEIISRAIPRKFWPKRIHPATRTFQAVRMEVNSELENLKEFLPKAAALLSENGVMAIISFHSLEDRIVKQFFAGTSTALLNRRGLPVPQESPAVFFQRITKKPISATDEEIQMNPRARSAHLRAARRAA